MMDQEIDLRPYFRALLGAWKLILGAVVIAGAAAALFSILTPRSFEASAQLLVLPTTSQVSLDPRVATRDTAVTSSATQRQALVDLASSPVIEARVAEELGLGSIVPGSLLEKIDVAATSDLIIVTASDSTMASAMQLVDAWARSYATIINELYTGVDSQTEQLTVELDGARTRYNDAQTSLEQFLSAATEVQAEQEVTRLSDLLENAQLAQQRLYSQVLTRTQELDLILEDARTVRAQIGEELSLADSLANLALRARVAGSVELPVSLQFDDPAAFSTGREATIADLDQFIVVLERERQRFVAQATELSRAIAAGDGTRVGLSPDDRARYEQELGAALSRAEAARAQNKLLSERRNQALEALKVLQAKSDELALAKVVPNVSVRVVGASADPQRSTIVRTATSVVLATLLAFGFAVVLVVGAVIVRRLRFSQAEPIEPASSERPVDRRMTLP